jgi:uncharacterized membrane protein YphA (DoxX/SURF4 family)
VTESVDIDPNSAVGATGQQSMEVADTNSLPSSWLLHPFLLMSRLTLGGYIVSAGWEKVSAELSEGLGTFITISGFQNRAGILPPSFAAPFGYAWPWLEVTFGFLLMIGLFGRLPAIVNATMLGMISFLLLFTGELFPRHHASVFCSMALLLVLLGPGRYSLDSLIRRRRQLKPR